MNTKLELHERKEKLERNISCSNYESEHLQALYETLSRYEEFIIEAEELAVKEFEFNNGIIKVENIQRERKKRKKVKKKTLDYFLENNAQYNLATKKYADTKAEINLVEQNYRDTNAIFNGIGLLDKVYSNSTESIYVEVETKDFVKFINIISKFGKRFVITNENFASDDSFNVRLSTHPPNGFKDNNGEYEFNKDVSEVIVFTNTSIVNYEKSNSEYKSILNIGYNIENEVDKKLAIAKKLSSKKIKNLKNKELKEYYDAMEYLQNAKSMSRSKFVKTFDNNILGVLKEADKRNITVTSGQ